MQQRDPLPRAFRIAALAAALIWIAVAGLRPAAYAACGSATLVGTESELNDAIADFNGQAGTCDFEIELDADITLTGDLLGVQNTNTNATLVIDGAGFTIDGDFNGRAISITDTPDVTIENITITRSWGPGITISGDSGVRVFRSTMRGNDSDGIEFADGELLVVDSTLISNFGEGIDAYFMSDSPTLTVINSTIYDNNSFGAVLNTAVGLFTHVTITGNSSAGLYAGSGSTVTVNNSILAGHFEDCVSSVSSVDVNYSLVQVDAGTDPCGVTDGVDGNIVGQNPLLGNLGNFGGPTSTIPLLELTGAVTATSPAIDAGEGALSVDETAATLDFDQRGTGFPRNTGAAVDMGAFEGAIEVDCDLDPSIVSTETELNLAIYCFNLITTPGNYEIELGADITLSTDLLRINNPTAGVTLRIDGAGRSLDGVDDHDTFNINDTSDVTIDNLTITRSGDDGIDVEYSKLRVSRTTISGSYSDGIEAYESELVVFESTLSNNQDNAIDAYRDTLTASVTVINSTITGNGQDFGGSAVLLGNLEARLTHVTIFQNFSGGLLADNSNVVINNSILGGNEVDCEFFSGGSMDVNFSLVQMDSPFDPCGVTDGVDGNIVGEDPFLALLGNYGGPTQTLPPLQLTGGVTAISPVLNEGNDALSVDESNITLSFDQRGSGFSRDLGANVDMGAVEGAVVVNCGSFPVTVTNETELNNAIVCYGGITTPGAYTINLGNDIDLSSSSYAITNPTAGVSLIINGNGNTLDGQGVPGVRPITVRPETTVTLNNVTITGGNIEDGGGIHNEGDLTLNNVTVEGNTTDNDGGGIFNEDDATMAINDSAINGNTAIYPDGDGGGIANDGHMTITDSTVSNNVVEGDFGVWAGGVWNEGAMTITRSTIANNSIDAEEEGQGGGIANEANLIIRDSTISGNEVLVEDWDARGGGIYFHADEEEVVYMGYGMQLTIINSTISGNSLSGEEDIQGGGLYVTDGCCFDDPVPVKLINVTLADNSVAGDSDTFGAGAYFDLDYTDTGLDVKIHNSILADNLTDGTPGGDCVRDTDPELVFESLHSLYEDTDGGACELAAANPDADGNIVGEDPDLGPLGNNGGPTLTHLPGVGSDALDKGDNALADDEDSNPLTADQRGYTPRVVNGTVDMGAVEVGAEPPASTLFMSATLPGTTGDGVAFGFEDILQWDGSNWSMFFDGSAAGLTPTGKWKHNINAFHIDGGDIVMSFTQNARIVPGITPKVDGMDLVKWDGSAFTLWFDGSDVGLTNKTQEKIDALHILPGSESPIGGGCIAYLLVSTQGPGRVTKYGGGQIRFGGEDVLGFCMTNAGGNTAGFWHMVLDGSVEGMPKNATDSISFSSDGDTMYLTTKGTFNVDAAAGGHSMVYKYDFGSGSFSGPFFDAAAEGLPRVVDGLQVVGDLP